MIPRKERYIHATDESNTIASALGPAGAEGPCDTVASTSGLPQLA